MKSVIDRFKERTEPAIFSSGVAMQHGVSL